MHTTDILKLTPAQFKRFRADFRMLTLHFRMCVPDALATLETMQKVKQFNRQELADNRAQAARDEWHTLERNTRHANSHMILDNHDE